MGGFFGAISKNDCVNDVFFGVDYHSHLGTRRGGLASFSVENGFQRSIHSIESSPFRSKFLNDIKTLTGNACIGCISDTDPQPIIARSKSGIFAICTIGIINNSKELIDNLLESGCSSFETMSSGDVNMSSLVASLISQKENIIEGIKHAQNEVDGSLSILILNSDNSIIAARDKLGRLPVLIGRNDDGYCVSFESFAYKKIGYEDYYELGSSEIVRLTPDRMEIMSERLEKMNICAFLWSYYGYPNSNYENVNVEIMRNRNGRIMAKADKEKGLAQDIDYVCGVPDSGLAHAIGYANESKIPFARPFIKYTPTWPRSFMPANQTMRNTVAKMKLIPVPELIKDKKLLFVDDSIVRGTQLRETVDFLYENGAKEVHMRSACPPIMFRCKYLNFSRSTSEMDLIARKTILELEGEEGFNHIKEYSDNTTNRGKNMRKAIAEKLKLTSLEFQSIEGIREAIGLDKCKICTYCWDGKE